MRNIRMVTICGKRWRFKRPATIIIDGERHIGACSDPRLPSKTIQALAELTGIHELQTIVHEVLHAGAYHLLREDYVESTSVNLGNFLWNSGYRKVEQTSRSDRGKKTMVLNIHAILQASAYHVLDEDYVQGLAEDLGNILWRLGYRKVKDNESSN